MYNYITACKGRRSIKSKVKFRQQKLTSSGIGEQALLNINAKTVENYGIQLNHRIRSELGRTQYFNMNVKVKQKKNQLFQILSQSRVISNFQKNLYRKQVQRKKGYKCTYNLFALKKTSMLKGCKCKFSNKVTHQISFCISDKFTLYNNCYTR